MVTNCYLIAHETTERYRERVVMAETLAAAVLVAYRLCEAPGESLEVSAYWPPAVDADGRTPDGFHPGGCAVSLFSATNEGPAPTLCEIGDHLAQRYSFAEVDQLPASRWELAGVAGVVMVHHPLFQCEAPGCDRLTDEIPRSPRAQYRCERHRVRGGGSDAGER